MKRNFIEDLNQYATLREQYDDLVKEVGCRQEDVADMIQITRQALNSALSLKRSNKILQQAVKALKEKVVFEKTTHSMVKITAVYEENEEEIIVIQGRLSPGRKVMVDEDGAFGFLKDMEEGGGLTVYPFMIRRKNGLDHGFLDYGDIFKEGSEEYLENLTQIQIFENKTFLHRIIEGEGVYRYKVTEVSHY